MFIDTRRPKDNQAPEERNVFVERFTLRPSGDSKNHRAAVVYKHFVPSGTQTADSQRAENAPNEVRWCGVFRRRANQSHASALA